MDSECTCFVTTGMSVQIACDAQIWPLQRKSCAHVRGLPCQEEVWSAMQHAFSLSITQLSSEKYAQQVVQFDTAHRNLVAG